MILPDVDTLVYAFHRDAAGHDRYARWLSSALAGTEPVLLADVVLTGFLRIVTNHRIFSDPAPVGTAMAFAEALRGSRAGLWLPPTDAAWRQLVRFVENDACLVGNLVPDAWIAALAVTAGARVATADAGFARFEGLRWFDPARV
jgi:toxin-antitoxin system PIN domain toxin